MPTPLDLNLILVKSGFDQPENFCIAINSCCGIGARHASVHSMNRLWRQLS